MIDWLLGKLVSRWWQRRVRSWHPQDNTFASEYDRIFPGQCLYCDYTNWANTDKGQKLKLEPHRCKAGNSPPEYIPAARVVKRRAKK